MNQITKDRIILLGIYLASFAVGIFVGNSYSGFSVIARSAMVVFATVLVLWLFSFISDNSSVFDPYWSIAPVVFLIYFWLESSAFSFQPSGFWFTNVRLILLFVLVSVYGYRLTWNFLRNWKGLKHEDWRYVDFRKSSGVFYWTVSLAGIHLFPAFMVFIGTLSLWVPVSRGFRTMNFLDIIGIAVTGMAILLEARADKQLHEFIRKNKEVGKTMDQGLWSVSRHPNYLGEISFWWGLYFFALAANPSFWWVIIGPVSITMMFVFISIPLIEKRLMERKKDYGEYKKKVPMLLPLRF